MTLTGHPRAFADTIPSSLDDDAASAEPVVDAGRAMSAKPGFDVVDTSELLPTRQDRGMAYRYTQDPYGRRGTDRPFAIVPTRLTVRRRWVALTVASTAAVLWIASWLT